MNKTRTAPNGEPANGAPRQQPPALKSNPEIDAKIDAYIENNPGYWKSIQALPRERLERRMVLKEVEQMDRQRRFQDRVMKDINTRPELKQAFEVIVKTLPEEQREQAMIQLATQARRLQQRSDAPAVKV